MAAQIYRFHFLFSIIAAIFALSAPLILFAESTLVPDSDEVVVYFYTESCPFCQQQSRFLQSLAAEYSELEVARFNMNERESVTILSEIIKQFPQARQYQGAVPLTFFRGEFFVGFDEQTARQISALVNEHSDSEELSSGSATTTSVVSVPLWGDIETDALSAPLLAMVLGIVDGFNVCSVGALILILSIVLKFRDRRLILLYGTIFIGVTAAMYLLLILAWYKLFAFVAPYLPFFEILVGLIAIVGGVYFLREFMRFQRNSVTCESGTNRAVSAVTSHLQAAVATGTHWRIAVAIAIFASVVVLIEFPCSAAIPLTLAATLVTMELSTIGYLGAMGIFIFFYLLDELIIFLIAVWSMRIWINSSGFVKYASLVGALVLFSFGLYYIFF